MNCKHCQLEIYKIGADWHLRFATDWQTQGAIGCLGRSGLSHEPASPVASPEEGICQVCNHVHNKTAQQANKWKSKTGVWPTCGFIFGEYDYCKCVAQSGAEGERCQFCERGDKPGMLASGTGNYWHKLDGVLYKCIRNWLEEQPSSPSGQAAATIVTAVEGLAKAMHFWYGISDGSDAQDLNWVWANSDTIKAKWIPLAQNFIDSCAASPTGGAEPPKWDGKLRPTCAVCGETGEWKEPHNCKVKLTNVEHEMVCAVMVALTCDHYCCGKTQDVCIAQSIIKNLEENGWTIAPPAAAEPSAEQQLKDELLMEYKTPHNYPNEYWKKCVELMGRLQVAAHVTSGTRATITSLELWKGCAEGKLKEMDELESKAAGLREQLEQANARADSARGNLLERRKHDDAQREERNQLAERAEAAEAQLATAREAAIKAVDIGEANWRKGDCLENGCACWTEHVKAAIVAALAPAKEGRADGN